MLLQYRFSVNFSKETVAWLDEQSKKHNVSVSELIRRIVDETRGAYLVPPGAIDAVRKRIGQ
jgi:hypothetical protein